MKSLSLALFSLLGTYVYGQCIQVDPNHLVIQWKAFKTPSKVGVSGKLPKFTLKGKNQGNSIKEISQQISLDIDTSRVDTGNPSRDKKIAKFFFEQMKTQSIKAKVKQIKSKKMTLIIQMNGIEKTVPMNYQMTKNKIKAQGFIDILDFGASKSLKAINKACRALHSGKTWSDVNIDLNIRFKPCS